MIAKTILEINDDSHKLNIEHIMSYNKVKTLNAFLDLSR